MRVTARWCPAERPRLKLRLHGSHVCITPSTTHQLFNKQRAVESEEGSVVTDTFATSREGSAATATAAHARLWLCLPTRHRPVQHIPQPVPRAERSVLPCRSRTFHKHAQTLWKLPGPVPAREEPQEHALRKCRCPAAHSPAVADGRRPSAQRPLRAQRRWWRAAGKRRPAHLQHCLHTPLRSPYPPLVDTTLAVSSKTALAEPQLARFSRKP